LQKCFCGERPEQCNGYPKQCKERSGCHYLGSLDATLAKGNTLESHSDTDDCDASSANPSGNGGEIDSGKDSSHFEHLIF